MGNLRKFVISDTHFGHIRVLDFEKPFRPFASIEEHDRELVKRWNAVVKPKDTVYHLGDVFFGKDGHKVLAELNGYKKLILGNHDVYPIQVYLAYFKKIMACEVEQNAILTHIPIHPDEFRHRELNIHGHIHSRKLLDERYVCVSVEHTNLQPVLLSDITTR